jgi:zinc protease
MIVKFRSTKIVLAIALTLAAFGYGTGSSHALEIKRSVLNNGAVLLVSEEHQLPMITMSIAFDAGSRRDPKGKEGLAELTAHCLSQGTMELTATQFNQKVDFMGSSVGTGAGRDYANAGFTSLTKYEADTLGLLTGILMTPGLRDADIARKRSEQVAAIKAQEEQPGYTAEVAFIKKLYGDTPYGHPEGGYAETVAKLSNDDVRNFYRDYYKMGSAVIAVSGDVKAEEVKESLEKQLAGLAGTVPPQPTPQLPSIPPGGQLELIDRNVAQANIVMGFLGVERSNPDYYRLQVMNYILGGGMSSRLFEVVRNQAGLAYSVGSSLDPGRFPGSFSIVMQTKNSSANHAISLVFQEMREIQEKPVTDAELDSAKKFLVGSFPLKLSRQSLIVGFMQQIELYGLGLDYVEKYPKLIESVSKEDIQRVAREYLHPDAVILVAVANQNEAKIDISKLAKPGDAASAK